ncbi:MAG: hypothetical protein ABL962_16385 [Fimbriimonadaceae bacterium]
MSVIQSSDASVGGPWRFDTNIGRTFFVHRTAARALEARYTLEIVLGLQAANERRKTYDRALVQFGPAAAGPRGLEYAQAIISLGHFSVVAQAASGDGDLAALFQQAILDRLRNGADLRSYIAALVFLGGAKDATRNFLVEALRGATAELLKYVASVGPGNNHYAVMGTNSGNGNFSDQHSQKDFLLRLIPVLEEFDEGFREFLPALDMCPPAIREFGQSLLVDIEAAIAYFRNAEGNSVAVMNLPSTYGQRQIPVVNNGAVLHSTSERFDSKTKLPSSFAIIQTFATSN